MGYYVIIKIISSYNLNKSFYILFCKPNYRAITFYVKTF